MGLTSNSSSTSPPALPPTALNAYFAEISSAWPDTDESSFLNLLNILLPENEEAVVSFTPATLRSVSTALSSLKSRATGTDDLSAPALRLFGRDMISSLCNIINTSLQYGVFPSSWKRSLLLPLPKVRSPTQPSDYRPISALPEASKVLEKLVHSQLMRHLDSHNLLDTSQSGFRPGRSTQTALLTFTDAVRQGIDDGKLTILVQFDLTKAFDMVDHSMLLRKLRLAGCDEASLRWFWSYLSGRSQAVRTEERGLSPWLLTTSGVPQGSVLGPLLFLLFINDIGTSLHTCSHGIFADDLQIYHSFRPDQLDEAVRLMNRDVDAVAQWTSTNHLRLNPNKSRAMLLGSRPLVATCALTPIPGIRVHGVTLPYESELCSLGVSLTPSLTWSVHVARMSQRVHRTLHSLRFYRRALCFWLRKRMVESLIFPIFDYCAAVYHDVDGMRDLRLYRLLNACVRFVFGNIPVRAHVTPYRLALGWLHPHTRREYLIATLAHRIIVSHTPSDLASRFNFTAEAVVRRSARIPRPPLYVQIGRTAAFNASFATIASTIINAGPRPPFNPQEHDRYRRALRRALFERDMAEWTTRATREGLNPALPSLPPPPPPPPTSSTGVTRNVT